MQTLFRQTLFCLTLFCLPSVLPVVNCSCAHKTFGRYDGELPQNFLWNNLPYFRALVPIPFGTCSNLSDRSTKNIGRSSIAIVVFWLCCCKFRSPCYCPQRSWLGLVFNPFLPGWGVIPSPFLHYKMFPRVQPLRQILWRGGEGMRWRRRLRWFFGVRRRSDSTWGRNTLLNCFLNPIPPKTMRQSGLAISCRFANTVFLRLDGSLDSRATSKTTLLFFQWLLIVWARLHSAPWLLLFHIPACTTEYTSKFVVFSLFLFRQDR